LLGLFFVALAIPTAVLAWQAYSRLKWESFRQYQLLAEGLVERIDRRLNEMIAKEEARTFTDYGFLVVEGAPAANFLQRSPLSGYPVGSDVPGLLGYFQIDAQGRFTTPLLPDEPAVSPQAYGIADAELGARRELRNRLSRILSQKRLASAAADRALPSGVAREQDEQRLKKEQSAAMAPAPQAASKFVLSDRDAFVGESDDEAARDPLQGHSYAPSVAERESGAEVQELVIEKILTHLDKQAPCVEASPLPPCRAPPQGSLFD
jgi:hypothetical protein